MKQVHLNDLEFHEWRYLLQDKTKQSHENELKFSTNRHLILNAPFFTGKNSSSINVLLLKV